MLQWEHQENKIPSLFHDRDEATASNPLTAEQGQTDKCLQANGMWHV